MNPKKVILIVFAIILAGCASYDHLAKGNRQKLLQLRLGMSMDEVSALMGTEQLSSDINQPYRSETLRLSDGNSAIIWFYYSDIKRRDGAISDDELSPVVFEDGKTVGWGWSYLDQNYQRYRIRISR